MGHVLSKLLPANHHKIQEATGACETGDTVPAAEEQTPRPYAYSPLPKGSIRILALPHDDPDAPLQCQLIDHVLHGPDERPDLYEALSYVWGSSYKVHSISIGPNSCPSRPVSMLRFCDLAAMHVDWRHTYQPRGPSIFRTVSYSIEPSGEISLGLRQLHELLGMYRGHDATDSRDKIFALLGTC
ncbi:hypothetical protein B0T25DRAFT_583012 [Lasiosphaeria hispida]|uniref:Heterokaryon incompatibility domain-containing protein n=1 Tax=Lasiosphaeria hispida TaxID=260671 RepID=A0AAJ0HG59_9PEZI|nr:hypothetical protein B0T25DRAFT_583012 [Lasiosphaeria hispida]